MKRDLYPSTTFSEMISKARPAPARAVAPVTPGSFAALIAKAAHDVSQQERDDRGRFTATGSTLEHATDSAMRNMPSHLRTRDQRDVVRGALSGAISHASEYASRIGRVAVEHTPQAIAPVKGGGIQVETHHALDNGQKLRTVHQIHPASRVSLLAGQAAGIGALAGSVALTGVPGRGARMAQHSLDATGALTHILTQDARQRAAAIRTAHGALTAAGHDEVPARARQQQRRVEMINGR